MSGKGYGNEQFLANIRELTNGLEKLLNPVKKLAEKSKLSAPTVRKLLNTLAAANRVTIEYGVTRGPGKEIVACALTREDAARQPSEPTPPAPLLPIDRHGTIVVALVDFDGLRNTTVTEFSRLYQLITGQGQVLFSDVYLSPNSYERDTVTWLWEHGFQVIVCAAPFGEPKGTHEMLHHAAIRYLSNTPLDRLLFVTDDLALGQRLTLLRKVTEVEVVIISPANSQAAAEQEKREPEPAPKRPQVAEFSAALPMVSNQKTPRTDPERKRTEMLRKILKTLLRREQDEQMRRRGFIYLLNYVWEQCGHEYFVDRTEVRAALQALVENQVLIRQTDDKTNSYRLNGEHVAIKGLLGS